MSEIYFGESFFNKNHHKKYDWHMPDMHEIEFRSPSAKGREKL